MGREEPVTLNLEGNAWRDVAGHVLRFSNPTPKAGDPDDLTHFAAVQHGVVGDITASRKVKVPECSMDELMEYYKARKPFPWHWGNSLYLEWHSEFNGRVLIESAHYTLELDSTATWSMTEAEEEAQREANGRAIMAFTERLSGVSADELAAGAELEDNGEGEDDDDETEAEAQADAEQARMDLLLDRVQARIERARDAGEEPDFERIMGEERERLRLDRGEPEPEPLTPEEEAERAAWIAEMNAITEEAQAEVGADSWKRAEGADDPDEDDRWHPLVERCNGFGERMRKAVEAHRWLTATDAAEHPLRELLNGVMIAGGKLAGALGSAEDAEEWPPEVLFAGSVLVRLKKAREHLRDALAGLAAADEQGLADTRWRAEARREVTEILHDVRRLIAEVRAVLKDSENPGGDAGED